MTGTPSRKELSRAEMAKMVHHAKPLTDGEQHKVSEKRKQLWRDIAAFVQAHGAAVTSIPGASPLRFEVAQGSDLPQRLTAHNCPAVFRNRETRVASSGFVMRDVFEIYLPR